MLTIFKMPSHTIHLLLGACRNRIGDPLRTHVRLSNCVMMVVIALRSSHRYGFVLRVVLRRVLFILQVIRQVVIRVNDLL